MIELIAVRHGQSTANVAFPAADAAGREHSGLTGPDADVALTPLGEEQAAALGRWLAQRVPRPDVIISSPYRRALDTARIALVEMAGGNGRPAVPVHADERLRDRELGILEMMTATAIRNRHPEEVARRDRVGHFFYRPPGGESMPDIALRLRSFLADGYRRHAGHRVLVVGHDATVLMLRYVIEQLTEQDWQAAAPVRNASVTRWIAGNPGLELAEFNNVEHLDG